MNPATYTKSGAKSSAPAKLDKQIFGLEVNDHELLKKAYLSYLAGARVNLAKTKSRGEVRGGGAKPYRQKGTGRARFGSSRNPIWTGGGVAFGPTGSENYRLKLSKRSKRLALRQALSLAAKTGKIMVIDDLSVASGKTKDAAIFLSKLGADGRVLIVLETKNESAQRATRNLSNLKLVYGRNLSVFEVLNADKIVFSKPALNHLSETMGGELK